MTTITADVCSSSYASVFFVGRW